MRAAENSFPRSQALAFVAAFATGGLLTLMVHFNGELAHYTNALFSSWVAHGAGTVAALLFLAALYRFRPVNSGEALRPAPRWAYFGGLSGAATVMLTSTAVNSSIGLSGTLALGLAGQVVFSLAADRWGLFGLARRQPDGRQLASLAMVVAGSVVIILFGRAS